MHGIQYGLALLSVVGAQLMNGALTYTPNNQSVPYWRKNGAIISSAGNCTNISDLSFNWQPSPCSQLYQTLPLPIGARYRFVCLAVSAHVDDNGNWSNGLLIEDGAWTCNNRVNEYNNNSFFALDEPTSPPYNWVYVDVEFEIYQPNTTLILHSDNANWACYANCTLHQIRPPPPTSSPTKTPTKTPTQIPTQIPTPKPTGTPNTAPTPECVDCPDDLCPGIPLRKEPADCTVVHDLAQLATWASGVDTAREVRNVVCSLLTYELGLDCHHHLDRNLYEYPCQLLAKDMYSGFVPSFRAKWCANPKNISIPILVINSSLATNFTALSNQGQCVNTEKYSSSSDPNDAQYVELGPLADVLAHPEKYPNFPPIKQVQTSQSTAVLFNTACLETKVVEPAWYALLGIFYALALGCCILLYVRRGRQPVRARDPLLLATSVFLIVLNFTWISIDYMTGNTASCGLISFGNLVAFPMLLFTYLLRAIRLFVLYKWSEGKLNHRDWLSRHRWIVMRKSFIIALLIAFVVCLIVFIASNAVDGTFTQTFLASGRCDWWDINQQIVEAAAQEGIRLDPTDFNPNGFVPYSVEYSSCVFCSSFGTQVLLCVLTVLILCLLVAIGIALVKINDQYRLWTELVGVIILLIAIAILRSIMFFPGPVQAMMKDVGSDLSAILLASVLLPILLASALYPALLTFSARYTPRAETMDGEVVIRNKGRSQTVTLSLDDVINDPVCLEWYKQFAVESFDVENVMYICAVREFEATQGDRGEAARNVYDNFIREGAPMAVNVESSMRETYDQAFGITSSSLVHRSRSQSIGSPFSGTSSWIAFDATTELSRSKAPKDLPKNFFDPITKVVFGLMLTNSWPRFKASRFWEMIAQEMTRRAEQSEPLKSEGTQMSRLGGSSSN